MKKTNIFRNLRFLTLLISSLLIVSSCDNEDDSFNPLLISITIPDEQFDGPAYLIASSPDGTVITFDELLSGGTATLSSDTYKDNSFVLTVAIIAEFSGYRELYATSYIGLNRGAEITVAEDNVGNINLNVSNFETDAGYYTIASNWDVGYLYPSSGVNDLFISKSPTRLFITKYDDLTQEPAGFLFPATTYAEGQTANVNLNANYTNLTTEIVNFTSEAFTGATVYGRTSTSDFIERYLVAEAYDFGNQLTIKYPGNTFPAYSSESYIETDDYYFTSYSKSSRSDFSVFEADVNLNVNGQTVNYSISSPGKIASFELKMEESDEVEELYWNIYAPVGNNQSFVIPQLPSEISNQFGSYNYNNWFFEDYIGILLPEGVNTVSEYLEAETNGSLFSSKNLKYLYLNLDSAPARKTAKNESNKRSKALGLSKTKAKLERNFARNKQ